MQLIQSFVVQLPVVIACAALIMAAMRKTGKEKGAGFIAAGAVGIAVIVIIRPLVSAFVMPGVTEGLSPDMLFNAYLISNVIFSLGWAGAIALIATGTFLRPSAFEAS